MVPDASSSALLPAMPRRSARAASDAVFSAATLHWIHDHPAVFTSEDAEKHWIVALEHGLEGERPRGRARLRDA